MSPETIAMVAHEVNRAYCSAIGDDSHVSWLDAPEWQKESAVNGVTFHIENDVSPEHSHENWLSHKRADGWVWGEIKDPEIKTHPCMVEYHLLPKDQRIKDYLFKAVVDSLRNVE